MAFGKIANYVVGAARGARTHACRIDTRVDARRVAQKLAGRRQECRRGTQKCVRHTLLAGCILTLATALSAAQFPVEHKHAHKSCAGVLTVDETGVSFAGPKGHAWTWSYQDIQELKLTPDTIYVLTYRDNRLLLGADRSYTFTGKIPADELYQFLAPRLDQRFVAAIAEPSQPDSWSIPAKHLLRITGTEGTLSFGPDTIVYSTTAKDDSRTWRYADIDSVSTSGPFQLTITTFERAPSHYGDRKGFNFQLKGPLTEGRYNDLWLEIERKNGKIQ